MYYCCRRLFVLGLLALSTTVAAAADTITLMTSGQAYVDAKPDIAYVSLYVTGGGILVADAARELGR